jgi:hypothetical protein
MLHTKWVHSAGTDVIILNIFSPINLVKNFTRPSASSCKKIDHNIGFRKNASVVVG